MQLYDGGTCLTCPHKPHLTHLVARRVSSEAAAREGGTGGRLVLYLVSSNPETKSQIRVHRGWGDGELFHGYRFSVWDDKKTLEMDSSDGCTT